ncbi:chromate transport protein [Lachnospiraceae bacterium KM106-2]|nr:chromate transport protein [Lachnospiraceae bacterium KM106-2]
MIYIQLFYSFIKIGLFSFGGGYAALPLIKNQVVTIHQWLSVQQFADLITISQMTPGPIAINAATFVGLKTGGIVGAIAATIGCILPSCIITSFLAYLYIKYRKGNAFKETLDSIRPAVVAMIASAGITILISAFWGSGGFTSLREIRMELVLLFVVACYLIKRRKTNPIIVMLLCGVGNVLFMILRR